MKKLYKRGYYKIYFNTPHVKDLSTFVKIEKGDNEKSIVNKAIDIIFKKGIRECAVTKIYNENGFLVKKF